MSPQRRRFHDAAATANACAVEILTLLEEALHSNGPASLAISGGSTPKLMFDYMARSNLDWSRVHLFWTDERAVPPSDPESNFRLAEEHFIVPAKFPAKNVHRIHGEIDPGRAARVYADEIREFFSIEAGSGELPHFDVVHLGMGSDGHTASLFPGDPCISDRQEIAASVRTPKPPHERVTLLPGVLLAARHTVFLVAGADKAEAARRVFQGDYDPNTTPAQLITREARRVTWFMDDAAAGLLESAATLK